MKKLIFTYSIVIITLFSCSKSDNSEQITDPTIDPNTVLLKKMIVSQGTQTITTDINYNGYKIVGSTSSDGSSIIFTYTGNLITKIEYYTGSTLSQKDTYVYNANGKIETFVQLEYTTTPTSGYGAKEEYVYNSDGTTSYSHYTGNLVSQNTLSYTGKIFYINGEVSKIEKYQGSNTSVINYTYDTKNNIFKNVLGYGATTVANGHPTGILNNLLTETNPSNSNSTVSYSYTYNLSDFPITSTKTNSFGTINKQYFY